MIRKHSNPIIHRPTINISEFDLVGSADFSEITNSNGTYEVNFVFENERKTDLFSKLQNLGFENGAVDCLFLQGETKYLYPKLFVGFEQSNYLFKVKLSSKNSKKFVI